MGKGDSKTTRGKRYKSSYGNKRPQGGRPAGPASPATAGAAAKKTGTRKKA